MMGHSVQRIIGERRIEWNREFEGNSSLCFDEEWNTLDHCCQLLVTRPPVRSPVDAKIAWEQFFQPVFKATYTCDEVFSDALFNALKNSLGAFVDTDESVPNALLLEGTSFKLKQQQVGFAKNLKHDRLFQYCSYSFRYDAGDKAHKCDHCCIVYDRYIPPQPPPDEHDRDARIDLVSRTVDVTALVDVKAGEYRCPPLSINTYGAKTRCQDPASDSGDDSLPQALLYNVDVVWPSLARRGVAAQSLPLVIVGARSEEAGTVDVDDDASTSSSSPTSYLYAVQGSLCIPQQLGDVFQYKLDRYVEFEGRSDDCDRMAAAVYLRCMRIGLQNAKSILDHRNSPPVPLICQNPNIEDAKLSVIGSPVPFANRFHHDLTSSRTWNVSQAELFSCQSPNLQWLFVQGRRKDGGCFRDDDWSTDDHGERTLVKISCPTVHHVLVSQRDCREALEAILKSDNKALRSEIGKVLLAYKYFYLSGSLLTVMKDLSAERFGPLRLDNFLDKMPLLWKAFCDLVTKALLPMAELKVVHWDIRPSYNETSNILCATTTTTNVSTTTGDDDVGPTVNVELRLIDYDSLALYNMYYGTKNGPAMHQEYLECLPEHVRLDACTFLFWQIAWLANVWIMGPIDYKQLKPRDFVEELSSFWRGENIRKKWKVEEEIEISDPYTQFKAFFDEDSTVAALSRKAKYDKEDIISLISCLGRAFGLATTKTASAASSNAAAPEATLDRVFVKSDDGTA